MFQSTIDRRGCGQMSVGRKIMNKTHGFEKITC